MTEIDFLKSAFKNSCEASAFMTTDGKLICAQSHSGAAFLSPVYAARFAMQYFPLQDQDWVGLNDPQSGGITPHGINLVGRLQDIIWSVRVEMPQALILCEKWEMTGHKLPPLPLRVGGQVNPQIPSTFFEKTKSFEDKIQADYEKLKTFLHWKKDSLKFADLFQYFQKSEKLMKEKLNETPWNDFSHKAKAPTGEWLNVQISLTQKNTIADFTGTSLSHQLELNEKLTESIVTYAFTKALECQDIYNHATESFFQIVKPRQSWLSGQDAKFPTRVKLLAIPFLESHLKQMLLKMKFKMEDWNCSKEGWLQLSVQNKGFITSDEIQKTWAADCPFIKNVGTGDLSLIYELQEPMHMLRVEAGALQEQSLNSGAQLEISLV